MNATDSPTPNRNVVNNGFLTGQWILTPVDHELPDLDLDDTAAKLLGLTHLPAHAREFLAHISPELHGAVKESIRKMSNGELCEIQFDWQHPQRGLRCIRCTGSRETNGTRLSGILQDVTNLYHVKAVGLPPQQRIISALANDYDVVFVVDPDTDTIRTIRAKDEYSQHFLRPEHDTPYSARYILDIQHHVAPADRERVLAAFQPENVRLRLQDNPSYTCTYHIHTADGNKVYHRAKFAPIPDPDSRQFIIGISDCTSEILHEMQVEDRENKRNSILKILSDDYTGLYYFNLSAQAGTVISLSDRILQDTGANIAASADLVEAFSHFLNTLVHPDDRHLFNNLTNCQDVKKLLAHRRRYSLIFRRNFNGEYKYTAMTFAKAENTDEEPVNVAIGFAEIDEQHREKLARQTQLQEAHTELSRAKAFADLFMDTLVSAYYVNLTDHSFTTYRTTDELKRKYGSQTDFLDLIRTYIRDEVLPADRDMMLAAVSSDSIRNKLQLADDFAIVYRERYAGGERFCRMHVIRGDENHAAFGFTDVDSAIRDRAHLEALENDQSNSLAMERALLSLQANPTLSNAYAFLNMLLECLKADHCFLVRFDTASHTVVIDRGAAIHRIGPANTTVHQMPIAAFSDPIRILEQNGYWSWNTSCNAPAAIPDDDLCRNVKAGTAVPVRVGDTLWGSINLAYATPHDLDHRELSFLKRGAVLLGAAIERKLVYDTLARTREEALFEAGFINLIINTMPIPCFLKDVQNGFRYVRCNQAFANHLKLRKEDILGHADTDLFEPDYAALLHEYDLRTLAQDTPLTYEDIGHSIRDTQKILLRWKQRITDHLGNRLVLGIVQDVTDERRRIAAESFKADVSTFIVNHDDQNEIIDYVAKRLMSFFHCEHIMLHRADQTRRDWFPDDNHCHSYCHLCPDCPLKSAQPAFFGDDNLARIHDTADFCGLRLPKDCPSRSILACQIIVDGLVWGKLAVLFTREQHHFVAIGEHTLQLAANAITLALQRGNALAEVSRKNDELRAALEETKRAERVKSTFLATMSHEIRTPLNAVIGFSDFLRAPNCTPAEQEEYLDGIAKSSHALLSLINSVLDLSKLESNAVPMRGGQCDFTQLFSEMKALFQFRVHEKHLDLHYHIPTPFPVLELQEERIRQILLNLIGNAVKFTTSGCVEYEAQWQPQTRTLTVTVSDTGIGIPREKLESIFDPFIQGDSIRGEKVYEGTGLGLPISRRLAQAAGGQLTVDSTLGKGSTFTLVIPNVDVAAEPPKAEINLNPAELEGPFPDDIRLTLVDDVSVNLRVLKQHLKNLGFNPEHIDLYTHAADALRALKQAAENTSSPLRHIVLTDMWMPEMDGEAFARQLREHPVLKHLPIAAVTADNDAQATFDISLFDAILTKPIPVPVLRKQLMLWCRQFT